MSRILILLFLAASFAHGGADQAADQAVETTKSHGYNPYRPLKYPAGADHIDYVNPNAPKGGELRLGTNFIFDCLNAMNWGTRMSDNAAPRVYELLFDTLMATARDRDYSYYGLVAEEVESANDDSFVIIRLNPNARFSNGDQVTAEDIAFSYQYVRQTYHYYDQQAWRPILSVQILDSRTLRFNVENKDHMKARMAISALGEILVLNKKFTEKYPRETWGRNGVIPLGSGPYEIESWLPRDKVVYRRRNDYWAKDHFLRKGLFNFDRISYRYFADTNIERIAVERGDLDFRNESKLAAFEAMKKEHPELTAEIVHSPRLNYSSGILLNTQRPVFRDRRVRKAMALAFPFWIVNHMMFNDFLSPVTSFFFHSEFAHGGIPDPRELNVMSKFTSLPPDSYLSQSTGPELNAGRDFRQGLEEASRLLAAAGWRLVNGTLTSSDGKPFVFNFVYSDSQMERWLMLYRHYLSMLGIEMELVRRDDSAFVGLVRSQNYDSRAGYFGFSSVPDPAEMESYFGSKYAFDSENSASSGIVNQDIDRLIDMYSRTLNDDERTTIGRVIDRVLLAEYYVIPFGQETKARLIHSPWLKHEAGISPRLGTDPIYTWWSEKP
jgi:microcin C transport system substrate-binding protein